MEPDAEPNNQPSEALQQKTKSPSLGNQILVGLKQHYLKVVIIPALAAGVLWLVTFAWSSVEGRIALELDRHIAAVLTAENSDTHKILLSQFDQTLTKADDRKVGALTSGLIELTKETMSQKLAIYLPRNNRGKMWVLVGYTGMYMPTSPIVNFAVDNNPNGKTNLSIKPGEIQIDLNNSIELAAKAAEKQEVYNLNSNTTHSAHTAEPTAGRLDDIHLITFQADTSAFANSPTASILIRYVVAVRPAIVLD